MQACMASQVRLGHQAATAVTAVTDETEPKETRELRGMSAPRVFLVS